MCKLVEAIFTNVKSGNDFLLMAGRGLILKIFVFIIMYYVLLYIQRCFKYLLYNMIKIFKSISYLLGLNKTAHFQLVLYLNTQHHPYIIDFKLVF